MAQASSPMRGPSRSSGGGSGSTASMSASRSTGNFPFGRRTFEFIVALTPPDRVEGERLGLCGSTPGRTRKRVVWRVLTGGSTSLRRKRRTSSAEARTKAQQATNRLCRLAIPTWCRRLVLNANRPASHLQCRHSHTRLPDSREIALRCMSVRGCSRSTSPDLPSVVFNKRVRTAVGPVVSQTAALGTDQGSDSPWIGGSYGTIDGCAL